jgi:2-(1,2-epoxy-1,2-dihydrophenyl)acetyl-CoA isomerase
MAYRFIRFESRNGVGEITLDRPEVLNAFNLEMAREVQDALTRAGGDAECRALLLTGAGRAFCAGQDLAAVPLETTSIPELGDTVRVQYNPVIRGIRSIEKPVVCAVNGIAAGAGASVALACDIVLASTEASFALSFCRIGLVPDSGATYFVPRLAGFGRASALLLMGEKFSATQAREWGLIWETCDPAQLQERARTVATTLAALPTRALALTKRALDRSWGNGLEAQLEVEADLQTVAGKTADFIEGVRAFREKRRPVFRGA